MTPPDDEEPRTTVLDLLRQEVKQEGYTDGTPEHDRRLRQMQVIRCREMRGMLNCIDCPVYDYCEIVKQVMRDNKGIS